ncbi:Pyrophosphatase PpaX [bioreactor metagenome]
MELLDFLEEQDIPKVVASSNQRKVIELLLEKNNLLTRFDMIVSAENVKRAKPDPEIFLLAQQKLGTTKENTLILEDSQNGILAAEAAEIPVIMVPDLLEPSAELADKTVAVVSSLHEIPTFI